MPMTTSSGLQTWLFIHRTSFRVERNSEGTVNRAAPAHKGHQVAASCGPAGCRGKAGLSGGQFAKWSGREREAGGSRPDHPRS